jgi:hypothetical protein
MRVLFWRLNGEGRVSKSNRSKTVKKMAGFLVNWLVSHFHWLVNRPNLCNIRSVRVLTECYMHATTGFAGAAIDFK